MEFHTIGDDHLTEVNREKEAAYWRHVLAENLQAIRKKHKLSQEDIFGLTGVSTNEVGKLERESTNIGLDTLAALAKGLGMEAKQLLDPQMNPAAVLLYPNEDVMDQIRTELNGLPPSEQWHIVQIVQVQAAHCRSNRTGADKLRIE